MWRTPRSAPGCGAITAGEAARACPGPGQLQAGACAQAANLVSGHRRPRELRRPADVEVGDMALGVSASHSAGTLSDDAVVILPRAIMSAMIGQADLVRQQKGPGL